MKTGKKHIGSSFCHIKAQIHGSFKSRDEFLAYISVQVCARLETVFERVHKNKESIQISQFFFVPAPKESSVPCKVEISENVVAI